MGYEVRDPMSWYGSLEQQLIAYISNRRRVLSFVNPAIAVPTPDCISSEPTPITTIPSP